MALILQMSMFHIMCLMNNSPSVEIGYNGSPGSSSGLISNFSVNSNTFQSNNTGGVFFDNTSELTTANYGSGIEIIDNRFLMDSSSSAVSNGTPEYSLDATLNWWNDETGPANTIYNPQGLGAMVSDDGVLFSSWYTDINGQNSISSEFAIQNAIDSTNMNISNAVSQTDGTITFDITVEYPDFEVALPHELLTDVLITSDRAFNAAAYVKVEGDSL